LPKLRPETKDARRRHLLEAAWRCAAEKRFAEMTVDDVCAEADLSKGAFYGYFESKGELLVGLLDEDSAALDRMLDEIGAGESSGVERLSRFSRAMLEHAEDPGRAQVRADLWAAVLGEPTLREHFAATGARRRKRLRDWIEEGVRAGELRAVPANALASLLLDPSAFRWRNIRRAVDELLDGIAA
jgi:AcrR family transcriptional regulator